MIDDVRERLVIAGGPRVGKTTMARSLAAERGCPVFHSDTIMYQGWSEVSEVMANWMNQPGPWIAEGVPAARALRKWLEAHPDPAEAPCDRVLVLRVPLAERSPGQDMMAKGCETVFAEIEAELRARGVKLTTWAPDTTNAEIVRRFPENARPKLPTREDEIRDISEDFWFR